LRPPCPSPGATHVRSGEKSIMMGRAS
jgi:hypothetical protein